MSAIGAKVMNAVQGYEGSCACEVDTVGDPGCHIYYAATVCARAGARGVCVRVSVSNGQSCALLVDCEGGWGVAVCPRWRDPIQWRYWGG